MASASRELGEPDIDKEFDFNRARKTYVGPTKQQTRFLNDVKKIRANTSKLDNIGFRPKRGVEHYDERDS